MTTPFPTCQHYRTEPRWHALKNGAINVWVQCLECGYKVDVLKARNFNISELREFDEDFRQKGRFAFAAKWKEVLAARPNWWDEYNKYLRSISWMELRDEAIKRDNYRCQHCGAALTLQNAHAHHLSYEGYNTSGHSTLDEITTLCRDCHRKAHRDV